MTLSSLRSCLWQFLWIGVALGPAVEAGAQTPSFCDPLLQVTTTGSLRYRHRPDNSTPSRCEGVFSEGQSGIANIELVGFLGESQDYDPQVTSALFLEWNSPSTAEASVRAVGLRRGLHYRMDTRVTSPPFRWPTDVISPLQLTRQELGVAAHIRNPPGFRMPQNSRLYLPVRLRRSTGSANNGCFLVTIRVAVDLSAVNYSLQFRGASPQDDTTVVALQDLGLPYYPARQPVHFRMPCLRQRGLYSLTIRSTATRASVMVPDLKIYFYNG